MNSYNKVLDFAGEHKKYVEKISSLTELKNKTILDVGGGSGLVAHYLAEHNPKEITVLDPSQDMLDKIETNCTRVCSSFQDFISKKKYDIVVCIDSLHHLSEGFSKQEGREEVKKGLKKILTLAKERVIIIDPNIYTLKGKWIDIQENYLLRINAEFLVEKDYNELLKDYSFNLEKWRHYYVVVVDLKK